MAQLFVSVWFLIALVGCGTLTAEECRLNDWERVGEQDGSRGDSLRKVSYWREVCQNTGSPFNETLYKNGRLRGLASYCSDENAVRLGLEGGVFPNVCPPWAVRQFRYQYQLGYRVYELRNSIAEKRLLIRQAEENASKKCNTPNECAEQSDLVERKQRYLAKTLNEMRRQTSELVDAEAAIACLAK